MTVYFLDGVSGAGKTELGERLQSEGFHFFPEPGRFLREHSLISFISNFDFYFEMELLKYELARFISLSIENRDCFCESSLFSNRAYLYARKNNTDKTSRLVIDYLRDFYAILAQKVPSHFKFILLSPKSLNTTWERFKEKWELDRNKWTTFDNYLTFYQDVECSLKIDYEKFKGSKFIISFTEWEDEISKLWGVLK